VIGGRHLRASLLSRSRDFRLLFLASVISTAGSALTAIALVLDVYARTNSPSWVGALLIVEFAPMVLVGLFLGFLVDRIPRKRLMIGADLVRALLLAILPLASSALEIVIVALLVGTASAFFGPASYAAVPNLVDDAELPSANGLMTTAQNLTSMLGPVAGAALVALSGPHAVYWLDAASFLVSAVLIRRILASFEQARDEEAAEQSHQRNPLAAINLVLGLPALRLVLIAWTVALTGAAFVNVSEVVLVKHVFNAGDLGFGISNAAMGAGIVVGAARFGGSRAGLSTARVYALAIALFAASVAITGLAPDLWVALPLLVLAGIGNGSALVSQRTLIQRGCPDAVLGRAVATLMGVGNAALGLSMAAAGPLTGVLGARTVWEIAGSILGAATILALALGRKIADQPAAAVEAPAAVPAEAV
jgi:MFS family permease